MLVPKGATLYLRLASLSRRAPFPPAWEINYFDSGTLCTTRLHLTRDSSAKTATVDLELLANPELPGGPIRRRIRFAGDVCATEPLGLHPCLAAIDPSGHPAHEPHAHTPAAADHCQ
jgi:hypothetical protein